jgi:hypothetical protein
MGADRNIVVRPYIACRNPQVETPKKEFGCLNSACSRHHYPDSKPFCSNCGGRQGEFSISRQAARVNRSDAISALDENMVSSFSHEDCDIWLSNVHRGAAAGVRS